MKVTNLKSVSLSLVLMISVSSVAFGQSRQNLSTRELAEKKTEMMKESLDLSKKQTKQVYQINLNYIVAKKATMNARPGFDKNRKHFKGEVCPPAPECPGTGFDKDKPQRPCPQAKPNCKPQMKPGCNGPAGKSQMRPECEKPKCDTSFMKGKPNQPKGCKPGFKPDSITCKYHYDLKQVLTASQYDKWVKMQVNCKKGHKGGKPMPCPKK